jgi:UDP-N-acetylmuramoyl-L-alanyl-D-glutamate--2,6-diaminopimelate ligase
MQRIDFSKHKHVANDSRKVQKGSIFVANQGTKQDGHDYIDQAIANGAAVVVISAERGPDIRRQAGVQYVEVEDTRQALTEILTKLYKQPVNIVAVTGTNGKTSVAHFYQQMLALLGQKVASIGTLGVISNMECGLHSELTTPGAIELHQILDGLYQHGVDNVILEASSHGLKQHRLDGIKFKAAAFTSFSQDHLDYHDSMDDYLRSKLRLFTDLLVHEGTAVINADMAESQQVVDACGQRRVMTYGQAGETLRIERVVYQDGKSLVEFRLMNKSYSIQLNLLGEFQVYNSLCALLLAVAMGFDEQQCISALSPLRSVPGRIQQVDQSNVFIDFAHTPDGLEKTLKVMKVNAKGRVIVVFGCGGDRDQGKRPVMGAIACKYADIVIVTDDNPRTEDPASIRQAILSQCTGAVEIGDRRQAIKHAVSLMKPDDLVLIAGKGHEQYQIIGTEKKPFDEYAIVKEVLDAH